MAAASLPPLVPSDDTHQAAPIIITTAILLFTSLLFVGTRMIVRSTSDRDRRHGARKSLLGVDDTLVVTATVLYLLQCVLVWTATSSGLGTSAHDQSVLDAERAQQIYYASTIFLVASLGCAKASIVYLVIRINSSRSSVIAHALNAMMALVAAWTLVVLCMFIFACGTRVPWTMTRERCFLLFSKWIILGVGEGVFEAGFIAMSIWNVWALQTSFHNKAMVVGLFAMRLPMIIIIALLLGVFGRHAFTRDPLFDARSFICLSQLLVSYSICTANFPAFRRLASDIRTDFGGFGTVRGSHMGNSSTGYIRATRRGQPASGKEPEYFPNTTATNSRMSRSAILRDVPLLVGDSAGYSVEAQAKGGTSLDSNAGSDDRSDQMIIMTRKDVVVSRGPRSMTAG